MARGRLVPPARRPTWPCSPTRTTASGSVRLGSARRNFVTQPAIRTSGTGDSWRPLWCPCFGVRFHRRPISVRRRPAARSAASADTSARRISTGRFVFSGQPVTADPQNAPAITPPTWGTAPELLVTAIDNGSDEGPAPNAGSRLGPSGLRSSSHRSRRLPRPAARIDLGSSVCERRPPLRTPRARPADHDRRPPARPQPVRPPNQARFVEPGTSRSGLRRPPTLGSPPLPPAGRPEASLTKRRLRPFPFLRPAETSGTPRRVPTPPT